MVVAHVTVNLPSRETELASGFDGKTVLEVLDVVTSLYPDYTSLVVVVLPLESNPCTSIT